MPQPRDRFARDASWEGAFETLESRVLLNGSFVNGQWLTQTINWHGAPVEVVRDSWLLTFTDRGGGAQQATQRAQQVASALGLSNVSVKSIGRGGWARVVGQGHVTEAAAINAVNQFTFLRGFEPERVQHQQLLPNDAQFGDQWPHQNIGQPITFLGPGTPGADIRTPAAWDRQTGSRNVIIAVLDTGVDLLHPDLMANLWTNPGEIAGNNTDDDGNGFVDDVNGYDFAGGGGPNPQDPQTQGHGTAVSGVIGAVGNNGFGVAGVAWQVSIMALKIFPANGGAATGDIIEAIDYVTMMRADFGHNIVASNNSYGAVMTDQQSFFFVAEEEAIQRHTEAGIVFVAAAGNDSLDNDGSLSAYPASYPNPLILSVAATDNFDELADFSNYGANRVHLGAPGVQTLTTEVGGGYTYIDGTSFASPYTAGVIALLASGNPFATAEQLRAAILQGVDPVAALNGRTLTGGRLNAENSLNLIGFEGPLVIDIFPGTVSGPVNQILVAFDEPIDPQWFDIAGIELRRANGDRMFNANDIFFNFSASQVTIVGSVMRINLGLITPLDDYRLTLRHEFFRDLDGNMLNGDVEGGHDVVYNFRIIAGGGPMEPNDTLTSATPAILDSDGRAFFQNLVIGDGANPLTDVDIFRVTLPGPGMITARVDARSLPIPSTLDSHLRLFDSSGRELAKNDNFNGLDSRLQFFVPSGGRYYIGVSGWPNTEYTPNAAASGVANASGGLYNLSIKVDHSGNETVTYDYTGPAVPIPAFGTIVSTINVPDVRRLLDVNVRINISHNFVRDLQVRLQSPSGTTVPLVLNRGGAGSNFANTIFDDSAPTPITAGTAPFTGRFQPEGELNDFRLESAGGQWRLIISDTMQLNAGTLLGWSLDMQLENAVSGAFEVNDTITTATDLGFTGLGSRIFEARIGDGAYGRKDVDMYRVVADAGTTINAIVTAGPGELDTVLRLFDHQGNQLHIENRTDSRNAQFSFPVQHAGTYYVAVSGAPNVDYLPHVGGSGVSALATGDYSLHLQVVGGITDGSLQLVGDALSVGIRGDGSIGVTGPVGISRNGVEFLAGGGQSESFFGATFNGFIVRNAGPAGQADLPVKIANQSDFANRRVLVEGLFRSLVPLGDDSGGLLVRRAISFGESDGFIAVDVSLTNTTFQTMESVGWVEGFRALHARNLGSNFTRTFNNVDNATMRLATATFSNADFPGGVTFGLGAPLVEGGPDVFLSVEAPGSVRDAFQVVGSVNDPDPTGDAGVEGDGTLAIAYDIGELEPGQSVKMRYFIFTGMSKAEVLAQFAAIENDTGVAHLTADPLLSGLGPITDPAVAAARLPFAIYHPEGFANNRANTFVPINNPHHVPVRVVVIARYENPALAPQVLLDGVLAPTSRDGITITTPELYAADQTLVHKDTPFALEIRSSAPVGATLSHFDFGIATGQAFTSTPSTVWTFSEGFKGQGVSDFLVFLNTTDQPIKATLTVFLENSPQQFSITQEVGAHRRGGWDLGSLAFIPQGPFALRLTAEAPVVAALSHFDTNFGGGFSILGAPNLGSTSGVSPEGQLGVNHGAEFITILNAGNQPADVTFTFLYANQSAFRWQMVVQPQRRSGFNVAELPGFPKLNQPYSVIYESSQPVSVTLATFADGVTAATRFSDAAYSYWLFSEGFRPAGGDTVREYLRIFNSTATPMAVEITIDFAPNPAFNDAGGTETFRRVLTPRAANDFDIHEFIAGARRDRDTFFSISVKTPTPVVAYVGRFDSFLNGGFGTLGTPLGNVVPALL